MPPDGMSSVFCSSSAAIGAIEAIDVRNRFGRRVSIELLAKYGSRVRRCTGTTVPRASYFCETTETPSRTISLDLHCQMIQA
jgi:hypothetical protein